MANKYLLSLNKVGGITFWIDSTTVEPCSWHELTSSTNDTVIEWKIVILAVDLLHVALDYWYSPAHGEFIVSKHHEHVLIPKIFFLSLAFICVLLISKSKIHMIAEIEIVVYDILTQLLDDFFILCLVDSLV